VQRSTEAIEARVEVSQQAVVQVKQAKTELIAKLQAQQIRLPKTRITTPKTGRQGRRSNQQLVWKLISELHARRFDAP